MENFKARLKKTGCFVTSIFFTFLFGMQAAIAGTIIVSNVLSHSVTLFDETTFQPIKEIKVGYMPHEVLVTQDGQYALVSNFGDLAKVIPGNAISVIDIANAKVVRTITLAPKSRPHGLALLSDNQILVTVQGIQSLLAVNMFTGLVNKSLALPGAGAHMVLIDNEKRFAYVANADSGSVCKIDLRNFSMQGEVKIGRESEGLALTNEQDLLFVTNRKDNEVAVIRTKDLTLLKKIKTDAGPVRVAMFNSGHSVVVTNALSGNAQIIDVATLTISRTFKTASSHDIFPVPINIFVKKDQTNAYITNAFAHRVAFVDLINGKVLTTFKSCCMPDGISFSNVTVNPVTPSSYSEFSAGPIEINANVNDVWQIAKNVEDYYRLSQGAIAAHVDGAIEQGKHIELTLYKDKAIGKFIPTSNEIVNIVDNDKKILSWVRKLPDGQYTERYQILKPIGANKTLSAIILRIPNPIGKITKISLGKIIDKAFQDLNDGIKNEAEKR